MSNNKKHHYVPRFYLKRFSPDERSISLWNIKNNTIVPSAKLKHQCYKDYFYGKELKVENALSLVEGHTSQILKLIDMNRTLPPYDSEEYLTLLVFMLMQYGRTAYAADALDETCNKIMKYFLGPKAKAEGIDLSKFNFGIKNSAQYSLGIVTQFYPLMLDLGCKLILNETNTDFVTSDNPVVLYNQLLSFKKYGSNTGLSAKGLQVFFPISSNLLLVFYDRNAYSLNSMSKPYVKITSPRDVYELNTLQMTTAYENVYFENPNFSIEALVRKASQFRRPQKSYLNIFSGRETESRRSELMATSRVDVRTNLKLSFIRLTKSAKSWQTKFQKLEQRPAVVVRNEKLVNEHYEFMKKVNDGEFKPDGFFDFMTRKYDMPVINLDRVEAENHSIE